MQTLSRNAADAAVNSGSVTLDGGVLDLNLVQGQTLRWSICFCTNPTSINSADATSVTLSQNCPIAPGECIRIYGHDALCEEESLNGIHRVAANTNGTITTADPLGLTAAYNFTPPVVVAGCDDQNVAAPMACKVQSAAGMVLRGKIMNRIPTENTRIAIVAKSTTGSPLVQITSGEESLFEGDIFTMQSAGIDSATVQRKYTEAGGTWVSLSQSATATACGAASNEVGCLAEFTFKTDACGCITATIPVKAINAMPLLGERISARGGCADYYQIGHYSIVANYLDECLENESHMVAHGCVKLTPTVYKTSAC